MACGRNPRREARAVEAAGAHGSASRIARLRWTGTKPTTGLQEAARDGALSAARRGRARGRRAPCPHRAHARRPGRDRAVPHGARQRPHRARRHGAGCRRCRSTAERRDHAGAPAARHSEGAADRDARGRQDRLCRRSVEPRSALHPSAAARTDAGARRARARRAAGSRMLARRLRRAEAAIEMAVDAAAAALSRAALDRRAARSYSMPRDSTACPPRSRCGCSAGRSPVGDEGPVELGKLEALFEALPALPRRPASRAACAAPWRARWSRWRGDRLDDRTAPPRAARPRAERLTTRRYGRRRPSPNGGRIGRTSAPFPWQEAVARPTLVPGGRESAATSAAIMIAAGRRRRRRP